MVITHKMQKTWGLWVLALVFTWSGLAALITEQVAEKLLATVVGTATQSGAIVLSVFFCGISLGGLAYPTLRRLIPNQRVRLMALEVIIAISGLLLSSFSGNLQTTSAALLLSFPEGFPIALSRFGVALLWLLPQTLAMGASYPALLELLPAEKDTRRFGLANLFYSLNLLGAVFSAWLGPYVMFGRFGLTATLRWISLVQLASAVLLAITPVIARELAHKPEAKNGSSLRFLLLMGGVSGFLVFFCEVIWYHLLGAVIGMSAYAFATMLGIVLTSLFAGGALVSFLPRRVADGDRLLPWALGLVSVCLALSYSEWDQAPEWLHEKGFLLTSFAEAEWLRVRVALRLIGPTAFALGTIYPLLLCTSDFRASQRSSAAAKLGAANAVGSILGSLVSAFYAVNQLGSENSLRLLFWVCALFAVALWWKAKPRRIVSVSCFVLAALLGGFALHRESWDRLTLTSGFHVYFRPHHVFPKTRLLHFEEGVESGLVTVVETPTARGPLRTLLTNGKFQGNDGGEVVAQVAMALLPILYSEGRQTALLIGYGTGQSARVVVDAGYARTEIVEIAPAVVRASEQYFPELAHGVIRAPGVSLFLEDGRNHLLRSTASYDLISLEISSIWFAGATNLYSTEFYRLCAERLSENGIVQQWIQLHHLSETDVLSALKSARAAFPQVGLWMIGGQGIILAAKSPFPSALAVRSSLERQSPGTQANLRRIQSSGQVDLWEASLLGPRDVDDLQDDPSIPENTDKNRYLEFSTPRLALSQQHSAETLALALRQRRRR